MDAASSPVPLAPVPNRSADPAALAWPRSAQWTTAFLLGVVTTLLAVQAYQYSRWGTRPTELRRAPGLAYRIDLNEADRAELLQLPGVGENLAARIQDYRLQHGDFRSVDELVGVRGVGPTTLDRLRPWVRVQPSEPEAAVTPPPVGVPRPRSAGTTSASPGAADTRAGKKAASLTEPIDINRATFEELQRLPGIGPKISQRILDERQKGPFKTAEELRRVSGIGPKIMERLRPYITVDQDSTRVVTTDR
jgi:competence protein ComEA